MSEISEPFKAFKGLSGMLGLAFLDWYFSKDRTKIKEQKINSV